jgi:hypothetical protein
MKKTLTEEQKEKNRLYQIEYRKANKDKRKEYREKNKEIINQKTKEWCEKNKEILLEKRKLYREENKEIINKQHKEYFKNNPDAKTKKILRDKKYYNNNKEKRNEYRKEKRKTDPKYRLECIIRTLINNSFKRNGFTKNSRSYIILGCSFDEFKKHLESQFESWMSWDNYGLYNGELNYGWDIDHIIPSSSAVTEEDVIKLNYYTNLKPLCSKFNRDIKRNNLSD